MLKGISERLMEATKGYQMEFKWTGEGFGETKAAKWDVSGTFCVMKVKLALEGLR